MYAIILCSNNCKSNEGKTCASGLLFISGSAFFMRKLPITKIINFWILLAAKVSEKKERKMRFYFLNELNRLTATN